MTEAPRGPRRAKEIFDATLIQLAERGFDGLTIEGVAARSGVNKTTIYRWWPSKAALVGAAVMDAPLLAFEAPDTGSLRGDLVAFVDNLITLLTAPPTATVARAVLGAAVNHPEIAELMKGFFADRLARERRIFDRGARRGELSREVDPMVIMDLLGGAVWFRLVFRQQPLPADFADRIVEAVLHGQR